jgi:hypothetical protein
VGGGNVPLPRPGDGKPNGGVPTSPVGPIVPDDHGHSATGGGLSSNGTGQGGPPIEYMDRYYFVAKDGSICGGASGALGCAAYEFVLDLDLSEDTAAEVGAAAFDWFLDEGIGTTLKFTSGGTYYLIEPEGGLGPWLRSRAGWLLDNDLGNLGKSSTYENVSLGLDIATVVAHTAIGVGALRTGASLPPPPSLSSLPAALQGGPATTHVYLGISGGSPVYTGITNNIVRRQAEHGARFLLQQITQNPLIRGAARSIEQALIVRNPGFQNIRNSISPRHSYYDDAVKWGEAWLRANGF